MRLVVKIGTQSILNKKSLPCRIRMRSVVSQIVNLKKKGHQVVLVSSGAVPFGREKKVLKRSYGNSIGERQVLSALGQHKMMNTYSDFFESKGMAVGQLLLTKKDFDTRSNYLNVSRLLRELLDLDNVIPIANENDSVSVGGLTFSDNDELAGLLAVQINADRLIILSSCGGLYDKNPSSPSAKLIKVVDPERDTLPRISKAKSDSGTGGMESKIQVVTKIAKLGIMTQISSIEEKSVITRLVADEDIGTKILPSGKKSAMKRWIALSAEKNKGEVVIDKKLLEIFTKEDRVVSILPVGILKCSSEFKKGDLVLVLDEDGNAVCVGLARYEAKILREFIGLKNKPEFIHRDYLHVLKWKL